MENINRWYSDLAGSYIAKNITPQEYLNNIQIVASRLDDLKRFLKGLDNKTLHILALTRILIHKDKPLLTKIIHIFIRKNTDGIDDKDISEEVSVLKKEIEETRAESKKEIEDLYTTST